MNKKGFTLIEVLLAITIIGVLSGFVFVQMNGTANATKDTKRKADIELIKNALISYRSENYSNVPAEDCVIGTCTTLPTALEPFLASLPNDPNSGSSYRYVSDGTDCTLYATLSDGSIYQYSCDTNQTSNVFPVDGACGSDDNGTFDYTYTPIHLCNTGTPSTVTGAGPWFWSCAGIDEGNDATCWASMSNHLTKTP
jgi:prepilin-type N-terminal cleavage/methylation domain-containing protein